MTILSVENFDQISLKKNFFTEEECFETILRYHRLLQTSYLEFDNIDKKIRDSKTFLFDDPILRKKFGHEIMEFQLTEYVRNGFYSWHTDVIKWTRFIRKKSYTVLLNDSFTGGEMEFDTFGIMNMSVGDVVSFDPYIRHQIRPVTSGVRYSLVAWAMDKR